VKKGRSGGVRTGFQSKFILSIWMSFLVLQLLDEGGDMERFDGSEFPDATRLAPLLAGAEVMAALDDLDPGNLVTIEVADQLTKGCMKNFRAYVERVGYIFASFLHVKPKIAIEAAPYT
jgi:hypothetical protein